MARAKKPKDKPVAAEPTPEVSSFEWEQGAQAELPSHVVMNAAIEQPAAQTVATRGQFRSWVVDDAKGYTRLTDEPNRRLVLQFAEKPQADVLAALKGAGFEFKPEYYGQKNAWVRRNDFEGRLHVEAIEKLFHEVTAGRESATR